MNVKGILPKMKILSSFTNPLEQLFGTIDFHSRKKILWKSIVAKFQSFFKISSFVFSRRKKLQVYNNLRVSIGNEDRIFILGGGSL